MKILLTSDWHLDAVTAGVPRLSEFANYLSRLEDAARNVDLVAILGDYFDPGKMNGPAMTARLFHAARALSRSGVKHVIWIAGNHDVVESSAGWTVLSPLAAALEGGYLSGLGTRHLVFENPAAIDLDFFGVLALPYVARSAHDPDCLSSALLDAKRLRDDGLPLLVFGHMTVPGALLGSESHEMARGRDDDLPFDSLADLSPEIVANGHYHKSQVVTGSNGIGVVIPGSPHRFTFGERADEEKGFMILHLDTKHA